MQFSLDFYKLRLFVGGVTVIRSLNWWSPLLNNMAIYPGDRRATFTPPISIIRVADRDSSHGPLTPQNQAVPAAAILQPVVAPCSLTKLLFRSKNIIASGCCCNYWAYDHKNLESKLMAVVVSSKSHLFFPSYTQKQCKTLQHGRQNEWQ